MTTLRRFALVLCGTHWRYLSLVATWTLLRVGTLAVGLVLQRIFDMIAGNSHAERPLWSLIALVAGIETARQILQFTVIIPRMEPTLLYNVRARLRDGLLAARLNGGAAPDVSAGQALTTMGSDVDEIGQFAIWSPVNIARWLFAAAAVGILMSVNLVLASGVLLLLVLLAGLMRTFYQRFTRYRMASMQATTAVRGALLDTMAGVEAIQAGHAEQHVTEHLRRLGVARRQAAIREEVYAQLQQTTIANAAPLGTGLVLLAAAQGLRRGTLTVGDIALFGYYLQMLAEALASIGMLVVRVQRLAVSLTRVFLLAPAGLGGTRARLRVREPEPVAEPPPPASGDGFQELRVRSLTYAFRDGSRGIADVSFRVPSGSLTVVAGRIAAGKTTLLRALLGQLGPIEGDILWNGRPVPDPAGFLIPPRCAYVPQTPRLFSGTVRENILLGLDCTQADLDNSVRRAALEPDLATMPLRLDTVIGPRGMRLSGGQIQRIAIARALVRKPSALVLDDSSSALDGQTEQILWTGLIGTGAAVLTASNRPALLRRADQIVLLRDGHLVGHGTLAELLESCAEMRARWASHESGVGAT